MSDDSISFIGAGNMATSLIGGLIANGFPASRICAADPDPEQRRKVAERFGVAAVADNETACRRGQTVVLSVKPQAMKPVVRSLAAPAREARPLIVSIAAGVREPSVRGWLAFDAPIVRTMPNTPALVGSGATALYANEFVTGEQRAKAESILQAVGTTLWVKDEGLLDAVTALSGSGPAYCFLLMEMMAETGEALGLAHDDARMLTLQTAFGAAKMALASSEEPAVLRERVTSPGGTTEAALEVLERGGVRKLFSDALHGAFRRSVELGAPREDD